MMEEKIIYSDVKKKLKEYKKMPFNKFIIAGLFQVSRKLTRYIHDMDDRYKYYELKKSIYELTIEMKAQVVTDEINRRVADELKAFLWSLLLVERENDLRG